MANINTYNLEINYIKKAIHFFKHKKISDSNFGKKPKQIIEADKIIFILHK